MSRTCKSPPCTNSLDDLPPQAKYCSHRCQGRAYWRKRNRDIEITPAVRKYLDAFDAWLDLDTHDRREAKADALTELIAGRI